MAQADAFAVEIAGGEAVSNPGQAILGIVGGVVGFFIGGPTGAAYGFQIGLAVGTVVSPTQLPGVQGPRLTENKTTTSQVGAPVVEVFGTDAVAGTVIWLGDVVETSKTTSQGGKGAPEQDVTTYSYTQSIAIGLCRGPMAGIRRIWENGKLVYDMREQLPGESDVDFNNRLLVSSVYQYGGSAEDLTGIAVPHSGGFTLYLGDEEQLPDPTIELKEGVGNVPGYRGLMYIVYPDRLLTPEQALRHPNFKFEVYDAGTTECEDVEFVANEVLYPWLAAGVDTPPPLNPLNNHKFTIRCAAAAGSPGDETRFVAPLDIDDMDRGPYDSLDAALGEISTFRDAPIETYLGFSSWTALNEDTDRIDLNFSESYDPTTIVLHFNSGEPINYNGGVGYGGYYPHDVSAEDLAFVFQENADHPGSIVWLSTTAGSHLRQASSITKASTGGTLSDAAARAAYPGYINTGHFPSATFWLISGDGQVDAQRLPSAPPDLCEGRPEAPNLPGYCVMLDGSYVQSGGWVYDDSRTFRVMRRFDNVASSALSTYPRGPALVKDSEEDTQEFWESAYAVAVAAGTMPAGLTYNTHYPQDQGYAWVQSANRCTISTEGVSIATIVRRICIHCGLSEDDIDVSDLEDRFVKGYQITHPMDGRSAINPLRSIGFFDAVESGGILKFPVRGKSTVRTLTAEDMGAHEFGSDVPALVTTKKAQDVDLPRQLFVQYRDPDRDYENGEQPSPTRLITDAVNDVYVDVVASIDVTQAAQCAEVLWADMWASRWAHTIALDVSQTELEPTDCFLVPIDGRLERLRMVEVQDSAIVLRQMQLVRDDDGSYVSAAIGEAPQAPPGGMKIYAQTTLTILDLPPLRATDDEAGVYAAVRQAVSGATWGGAQIYTSADAGASWNAGPSIIGAATVGTLVAPFGDGETTVWDDETVIELDVLNGSLASAPDEDVYEGANVIAIGADGRWEVLQFGTAVQTGPTTWEISHLLRGRRGTEHNMLSSQAGDTWVLVSGAGVARIALPASTIGTSITYRPVTLGTQFASASDTAFTGHGQALVPFSPVSIEGAVDSGTDDILITWIRRDRLGEELPDGSEIAMSDPPESYEVDILDGNSPSSVARTLSSNTQSVTYTLAQQTADFGGPASSLQVRIYQISPTVGRGTPGEATIV